jgi:hypothetical protein
VLIPSVNRPQSASLITARCYNFVTLRVERDLGDFILMTLKQRNTSSSEHIIYSCNTISTGSG